MESSEEGDLVVARLDGGEDLVADIEKLSKERSLDSAIILSGIGMLEDPVLGFFDGERYIDKKLKGCFELVAMHGSIAGGNVHLHLALGNEECGTLSGHLLGAKVAVQVELVVRRLKRMRLSRVPRGKLKVLGFGN